MINFENGKTPLSEETFNKLQSDLLKTVFPIGSTYITQEDTNPNTILGFGTWERLKGKVCLGLDEDDEDFNEIGKTGGEKAHKIQGSELPIGLSGVRTSADGSNWQLQSVTDKTASQKSVSIMQPYEITGYMWIRRS